MFSAANGVAEFQFIVLMLVILFIIIGFQNPSSEKELS